MLEREVERFLVNSVKGVGGECLKLSCPGRMGMPDRLVILKDGTHIYVELKQEHGVLAPAQKRCHAMLRRMNCDVRVLYGMKDVIAFMRGLVDHG